MHFGFISSLLDDPINALIVFLLAMPGRVIALSAHEAAHGYIANRCGDPTAKWMGRITLNPLKHLDPVGLICMLVLGFGWAKPVPVDPRNFRNGRRDDLKVALAGITMNLILFLTGLILMYAFLFITLIRLPESGEICRMTVYGTDAVVVGNSYLPVKQLFTVGINVSDWFVAPVYGPVVGYIYEMLTYFIMTNLVLAVFNLIPVPPLDGYHVLNDLILRRPLFASRQAMRIGAALLYLGVFTGALSRVLSFVYGGVLTGLGTLAAMLLGVG